MLKSALKKIGVKLSKLPYIGRFFRIVIAVIRLPEFRNSQFELNNHQHQIIATLSIQQQNLENKQQNLENKQQNLKDGFAEFVSSAENIIKSAPISLRNLARDLTFLHEQNEKNNITLDNLNHSVTYLLDRVEFIRHELMFEMQYGQKYTSLHHERIKEKVEIINLHKLELARKSNLKLNIGCGHHPIEGYINIDRRKLPGIDIVAEIEDLPFGAEEVNEIFSSHLIEHFPQEQLRRELLPLFYKLLKPGGKFRSVVSDAHAMIKAYQSSAYSFSQLKEVTFGGQDYDGDFHYNMFTTESFSELLQEVGFNEIKILAENRVNGSCREFEICAERPKFKS